MLYMQPAKVKKGNEVISICEAIAIFHIINGFFKNAFI